jgi:Mg/Co/Ni transporter MgtE
VADDLVRCEMFTATAMSFFKKEIEAAVVLALFLPLIISSAGNSCYARIDRAQI